MIYELLFTETAVKELEKLDEITRNRILSVIERVRIRPKNYLKRLVGGPYYKLRAGDYRVIMDLQQDKMIIVVITLGHRKKIYKRF